MGSENMSNQRQCDPGQCPYCLYVGEGDFLCEEYQELVMCDWEPTEDYLICKMTDKGRSNAG